MISISDQPVGELLEALSARTSAPGGGSAAGVALGLAAALCAMAARFSDRSLEGAAEAAEMADSVRLRALQLADEDAAAYGRVLAARRLPADVPAADREEALATAVAEAVAVPLEVAELGAELARLANEVASSGNPRLLGDAITAVLLAEAAAAAAATLVEINLAEESS